MSAAADFPPVTQVVPHRGAMLLLERVLAHEGDHTAARVRVGRGGWLQRDDGSVPAWLALEYMAQCAAAHEGLLARAEGRPLPRGFLITARTLCLHRSHFTGGSCCGWRRAALAGAPAWARSPTAAACTPGATPRPPSWSPAADSAYR